MNFEELPQAIGAIIEVTWRKPREYQKYGNIFRLEPGERSGLLAWVSLATIKSGSFKWGRLAMAEDIASFNLLSDPSRVCIRKDVRLSQSSERSQIYVP